MCDPAPPAEVSTMVGVMEVMEGCSVSTPPGLLAARVGPDQSCLGLSGYFVLKYFYLLD